MYEEKSFSCSWLKLKTQKQIYKNIFNVSKSKKQANKQINYECVCIILHIITKHLKRLSLQDTGVHSVLHLFAERPAESSQKDQSFSCTRGKKAYWKDYNIILWLKQRKHIICMLQILHIFMKLNRKPSFFSDKAQQTDKKRLN